MTGFGILKPESGQTLFLHQTGKDISADVVVACRVIGVMLKSIDEQVLVKNVDTHVGKNTSGSPGQFLWSCRLLFKTGNPVQFVDFEDPKLVRRFTRINESQQGHIRAAFNMKREQFSIVHVVNVIRGKNEDISRLRLQQ